MGGGGGRVSQLNFDVDLSLKFIIFRGLDGAVGVKYNLKFDVDKFIFRGGSWSSQILCRLQILKNLTDQLLPTSSPFSPPRHLILQLQNAKLDRSYFHKFTLLMEYLYSRGDCYSSPPVHAKPHLCCNLQSSHQKKNMLTEVYSFFTPCSVSLFMK